MAHSIYFLLFILFSCHLVTGVVFKNVKLYLTSKTDPAENVFIQSSDSLSQHVNTHPHETVLIKNQTVSNLAKNSVANLPNTKKIIIVASEVKTIEPGAFNNVPQLRELSLNYNLLEEVQNGVFSGLGLVSLSLKGNRISKIDSFAFNNMSLLEKISLKANRLSVCNSDWFLGSPVSQISLSKNFIDKLPSNVFAHLQPFKKPKTRLTVEYFGVGHNGLWSIHPDAFNFVEVIDYLDLSNNSLYELEEDLFHSVEDIGTLDLSKNPTDTHNGALSGVKIHQLVLVNNTLSCSSFFDVSRIEFVFLQQNSMTCECLTTWKVLEEKYDVTVHYGQTVEARCVRKNGKKT